MSEPLPLSVVVITKNEASRLGECLESVPWAGEILIVDDESTDETLSVARRYTDQIIQRRMDVEGRHRNFAYSKARYDWIFSLDADERVTPELAQEIRQLLTNNPSHEIYAVPRRNFIGQRWLQFGGWYPSAQVKLFKRTSFRWEETTVHPRAISDKPWGVLKSDLIHFSYRNLEDFVAKLNRQTTLEAQKWLQDGRRMAVGRALWRSIDRFFRSWRSKKGYKDGQIGFIAAVLGGMYQFVSYAKYWNLKKQGTGDGGQETEKPESVIATPSAKREGGSNLLRGRRPKQSRFKARLPRQPGACAERSQTGLPRNDKRQTISAVILTKNEAGQIEECLKRIQWVDEIIVVDGESADGTPEICKRYGARVITHRFEGDFGQERNIGSNQATKDWILQLDADDRVTEEFHRAALQILEDSSKHDQHSREPAVGNGAASDSRSHAAYRFRRRNCFLGHWMKYGGWYHYSLHFFQRGKARYQGRVHHDLIVEGSIGFLEAPVDHIPFHSFEQFIDRQNRYTTLEARELVDFHGPYTERELRYQMTRKPLKLFWKMFVKKHGFREGMTGFLFAGFFAFVHFLKWAKVWEILDEPRPSTSAPSDGAGKRS